MKVKTSQLVRDALNFAVATCEGYTDFHRIPDRPKHEPQFAMMPPHRAYGAIEMWEIDYSSDWEKGGSIIEREIDALRKRSKAEESSLAKPSTNFKFKAEISGDIDGYFCGFGPTPLIAAMRCYVASKMGEEVEIPEELL
jgi:Protein of unknown function (DUF2591)